MGEGSDAELAPCLPYGRSGKDIASPPRERRSPPHRLTRAGGRSCTERTQDLPLPQEFHHCHQKALTTSPSCCFTLKLITTKGKTPPCPRRPYSASASGLLQKQADHVSLNWSRPSAPLAKGTQLGCLRDCHVCCLPLPLSPCLCVVPKQTADTVLQGNTQLLSRCACIWT